MNRKWHGYIHSNGTLQVKPDFCDIDITSPFVEIYLPIIIAKSREDAIEKLTESAINRGYKPIYIKWGE